MLQVADVSFDYSGVAGSQGFALRNISLEVRRGDFVGLLGPNGCGKTTLLRLMAGTAKPGQGTVRLEDEPLSAIPRRKLARRIAMVPQETHPAFDYTALEMVLMGRHPHLGLMAIEGPDDIAIAYDAMDATGTRHLGDRAYMTLSGGEKQRVVIASALAQAPDLLLLDEPTASLDLGYQLDIAALLVQLNQERGVTLVLATHDLNLAASVCNRLTLMRQGQVLAAGLTGEVLTSPVIRQVYGVDADVRPNQNTGHLTVVPLRRSLDAQ